jgi:serine-type D-Ala-D-Ala endopeptidase (penicillin-binding protein 7)
MSIILSASFEALAESNIEADAPMGIVSVTATPALDHSAAGTNALRPSAETQPADTVLLKPAEPLERVFVSNIPGVGQSLPEPVQLSETSTSPSPATTTHRKLAIVADASSADMLRKLRLSSTAAIVVDQEGGRLLYAKNGDEVRPIASITKLMTAMVVLDSGLPLDETITITTADAGVLTTRRSRLRPGVSLTRGEMLKLALMASENPAAAALARSYPGGTSVFVDVMNNKARELGMRNSHFLDPTGLNAGNVSTPYDLALMVDAGYEYPVIREFTTSGSHNLALANRRRPTLAAFYNSNRLVNSQQWQIGLSKTGYISEAGRCLVMQATIADKPVIIVLLDSSGKISRVTDANRIRHWLEGDELEVPARIHRKRRM